MWCCCSVQCHNACNQCCRECCGNCYTNCDDIGCCQDCLQVKVRHGELEEVTGYKQYPSDEGTYRQNKHLTDEVQTLNDVIERLQGSFKLQDEKLVATEALCKQLREDLTLEKANRKKLTEVVEELQDFMDETRKSQHPFKLQKWEEEHEELQHLLYEGREERDAMKEDIAYLKQCLEQQLLKVQSSELVSQAPGAAGSDEHEQKRLERSWIVPAVQYHDDRATAILHQLMNGVDTSIEVVPLESGSITLSHSGRVLLPCIGASRIGSDLQAAVDKAKLGPVSPIILIFHHLAPHNCKIYTATKNRLSDRSLVEHCQDMIDVVFWNGNVYDCEANAKAVAQLKQIASQF